MAKKVINIFKALIVSYVVTGILLVGTAFLVLKAGLKENLMRIIVMVIYGIATILGGYVYGKITKTKRLLRGILLGFTYFAMLFLVSLIVRHGAFEDGHKAVFSLVICIIGGILGGVMS